MLEIFAQSISHAGGVPMAEGGRLFPERQARTRTRTSRSGLVSRLAGATKAALSRARLGTRQGWSDAACDAAAH